MGSFNTTCFASQQTIVPEAECLIFPIKQQTTYNEVEILDKAGSCKIKGIAHTRCYPDCFWEYAGPILKGVYYDYGQFKLHKDDSNTHALITFFNELERDCYQTKGGDNIYHDLAFNFQELYQSSNTYTFEQLESIWDSLWKVADKNRVFLKNYSQDNASQLQFAVMHKSTAEYLTLITEKTVNWQNQSYAKTEYFANYIKESFDQISQISQITQDTATSDKELNYRLFLNKISFLKGYGLEHNNSHLSSKYNNYNAVSNIFESFKDEIINKQLTPEFINALRTQFDLQIEHYYIHAGLDALNIRLAPQVYADPDYSNEIGDSYLKMIKAVNKQIKQKIKDKYDE